jgi:two-component system response regulator RegX3
LASTILVVDDEATVRDTVAVRLEQDGYRVVTAADGRAALELFRAEKPDLILLDLMLPELSGIEITRIIRGESDVPILMLTARDSEIDKVVGLELGADDYVTKPFSLRELQARVGALLRRREAAGQAGGGKAAVSSVEVGRVTVDLAGHRILRDGKPVPMKPKAFELLAFLARNQGQAFSRQQLLERVWGSDYPG